MPKITIDGQAIEVKDGSTVLDAAKLLNIKIPTLCYHPDQAVKANCRICVVEVEGQRVLQPACAFPVTEGMVAKTNSPKVRKARENILELILAHHPQNCLYCYRNGNCELQTVTQDMHFVKMPRYQQALRCNGEMDLSSPSIIRNPGKCIVCGRCEYACSNIQSVYALAKEGRGFDTVYATPYGKPLADSPCVNCGQCVQACPVAALNIRNDTEEVWDAIADEKRTVIAQVAPAVRITIAEALGEEPGTVSTGRLVTALKRMGVDTVFDTNFTADLTIMEEGTELLTRLNDGGKLPMITSCSPGWIKFCETYYPDLLPNLSSCKSPQGMFGALIKTYYAEKLGKAPEDLFSLSIMPCTAKKFEAKRPELGRSGSPDVDTVITVQELADMIKSSGISFKDLPETDFDDPFGLGSGAGEIFGATGGVMEAALRTVYEVVTGNELPNVNFTDCRGFEGIKEATVQVGALAVKVAIAHGLGNARKLMDAVRSGEADYHFIEVMACPGGCIGGGGNPFKNHAKMEPRLKAVYTTDEALPVRKSHKNAAVEALYREFLGKPNSHKSHELLHTHYTDRSGVLD
ncbi:MAG: NADH-dependent [FeFe] hydrogenase, group A6 [Oscillospiraceae bacterium]|nr:NADH-dependent [FeFe] hydrogenase, group A6 [Oscillospiraceae bacterium]